MWNCTHTKKDMHRITSFYNHNRFLFVLILSTTSSWLLCRTSRNIYRVMHFRVSWETCSFKTWPNRWTNEGEWQDGLSMRGSFNGCSTSGAETQVSLGSSDTSCVHRWSKQTSVNVKHCTRRGTGAVWQDIPWYFCALHCITEIECAKQDYTAS